MFKPANRQQLVDTIFVNLTRSAACLVLALLAGIIVALIYGSMPSIEKFGLGFITATDWNPVTEIFGAGYAIAGTLLSAALALLIALPVSFGIALFLTQIAPLWLRRPLGMAIELLAGIPSIIYGMWGLLVLAPLLSDSIQPWIIDASSQLWIVGKLFDGPPLGIGLFTAGLVLAIMVIPFIASVMRDVFDVVPSMLKESAYGLGATTWEVVWRVVLPYTKTGVIGGVMLGLGRALGETMAVTFVIGNSHEAIESLFHPGHSIASSLANEFTEALGTVYKSALIELGLILFVITLLVLTFSKLLLLQLKKREGRV